MSRAVRGAQLLIALALLATWWVMLAPTALGGRVTYVLVRGDSMQPTYDGGDLVLVRAADRYAAGDVIAYRVPDGEVGAGRLVIHRIVEVDGTTLVLQGDNNPAPDPWRPTLADVAGAAWLRLPSVGRMVALLHQPAVLGALSAALVVWIAVLRWVPAGSLVRPSRRRQGA